MINERFHSKRQVSRDLNHIKEHLERALTNEGNNGDIRLALGIVLATIKREKERKRRDEAI